MSVFVAEPENTDPLEGFCVKRVTRGIDLFVEKVRRSGLCGWGETEPG